MTYRESKMGSKDKSKSESRLNQQIKYEATDEGCPVLEESGSVCGESETLSIIQEFRQIYDDCIKNLEGCSEGVATLQRLAPFRQIIDNLWEQNTLLVETVEELEQEATYRVTNLQNRLNKSCQKMKEYKEDIGALVEIVQRFLDGGELDLAEIHFNTLCLGTLFGNCSKSFPENEKADRPKKNIIMRPQNIIGRENRSEYSSVKNPANIPSRRSVSRTKTGNYSCECFQYYGSDPNESICNMPLCNDPCFENKCNACLLENNYNYHQGPSDFPCKEVIEMNCNQVNINTETISPDGFCSCACSNPLNYTYCNE